MPNQRIPKNVQQAFSLQLVEEWGPAINRENVGFLNHDCFAPILLPPDAHVLPGLWVFTQKHDNTAKTTFCVEGHRQLLGSAKVTVLFYPVVTIVFCWRLLLLKATLCIKWMLYSLYRPFCMVSFMMLIFTSPPLLVFLVPLVVCSNFSVPSMGCIRLPACEDEEGCD